MKRNGPDKDELLRALKTAVRLREESWDAERDFELELECHIENFDSIIEDFAAVGAYSVTIENVEQLIKEAVPRKRL